EYLRSGTPGLTLTPVRQQFDQLEIRLFCIHLAEWWGRGTLLASRHPYMPMSQSYPWHTRFRVFAAAVPELDEMVRFDDQGCHFASDIPREEQQAITEYVRANYKPTPRALYF